MLRRQYFWFAGSVCFLALFVLTPGTTWAAEEGAHEGGLISIDKSLIVQIINFVALLVILRILLYKPFLTKMEERTAAIRKSLDEAQAARAEAARQQEEYAARLRAAYAEATGIREQALREAAEDQKRLVDAARAEAQRIVDAAKAEIEGDVRRARTELRREVGDIATSIAETLVRKSLRADDHRRIVADAIARLEA